MKVLLTAPRVYDFLLTQEGTHSTGSGYTALQTRHGTKIISLEGIPEDQIWLCSNVEVLDLGTDLEAVLEVVARIIGVLV